MMQILAGDVSVATMKERIVKAMSVKVFPHPTGPERNPMRIPRLQRIERYRSMAHKDASSEYRALHTIKAATGDEEG